VAYDSVLVIAVASTVASLGYGLIGGGFGDGTEGVDGASGSDAAEGSSWSVLQFLSVQFILILVMSFSWSWLYWRENGVSTNFQLLATLATGSLLTAFYFYGMKVVRKLNSPTTQKSFQPRPGMSGRVYVRIPDCRGGTGIVTFMDSVLGDIELDAITDETSTIANGKTVVVTDVLDTRVLVRSA